MEKTAQQIIATAMTDRSAYSAMAEKENAVWAGILPTSIAEESRAEDAKASAELRMGRHHGSVVKQLKERGISPRNGLSLGCGAGRFERALMKAKLCESFHGIDISAGSIDDAQAEAEAAGLNITYQSADLNFIELPENSYDLIVAQTSLHHVLHLEHVAFQVWRSLKPGGYLWIHDFIGETQGQYAPRRLQTINDILAILPEKHRQNKINGRLVSQVVRPKPGGLGSPFEKIRSEDIVPVFKTLFDSVWEAEFTAFLDLVAPPGTRASYVENEDTRTIMELMHVMEEILIRENVIKPIGGQYLMTAKSLPDNTKFKDVFTE